MAIYTCTTQEGTLSAEQRAGIAQEISIFRENRSTEVKTQVLNELWSMYKNVTGLSDDQIWVSLTEIPARDAMFLGAILPEPGHEAEWLASLGRTKEYA